MQKKVSERNNAREWVRENERQRVRMNESETK